jgi:tuberculosinol/isotuberculosinol synthase
LEEALISWNEFSVLPVADIARIVRDTGPQVCVFPINGTRRWAWLEHRDAITASHDPMAAYMDLAGKEYVRLFGLLFEHGIDAILSPVFGSELLARGDAYVRNVLGSGVHQFVESPVFADFYQSCGVRARFYGDLTRLVNTPYSDIIALADALAEKTHHNSPYRLYLGMFADDPLDHISRIVIKEYQEKKAIPDRAALVEAYYGDAIEPVTLFIGFDKPAVYDYPLLATGQEDLYFTVAPSPYLDAGTLRSILYDHLFTRHTVEPEWEQLPPEAADTLHTYYSSRATSVQGVGKLMNNVWLPQE